MTQLEGGNTLAILGCMNVLTRKEWVALLLALAMVLTGWLVKAWRLSHPEAWQAKPIPTVQGK